MSHLLSSAGAVRCQSHLILTLSITYPLLQGAHEGVCVHVGTLSGHLEYFWRNIFVPPNTLLFFNCIFNT